MKITLSKNQWEFIGSKAGWIKTAKNPLNLPQDLLSQINANMDLIMKSIPKAKGGKQKILDINFTNPYDNKPNMATIYTELKNLPSFKASIVSTEDNQHWDMRLTIPTASYQKTQYTENDIYSAIIHEFGHAIDPKSQKEKFDQSYSLLEGEERKSNYSKDPREVDAMHTTIVKAIVNDVNSKSLDTNQVYNWLKSPTNTIIESPSLSYIDKGWFNYWIKNNPEIIKLLKQRIYTALQSVKQTAKIP